jgi:hypothetical protein
MSRALKNFYSFQKIPQNYIQILPPLPQNAKDFPRSFKNIFPITQYHKLKDLRDLKSWLSTQFNFYGPLPKCYFDLPPPKKQLPSTYQLLPENLRNYFSLNSPNSITPFKDILNKLRESYYFTRIPNDFFYIKVNLPNPKDIKHPSFKFNLPITNPDEVSNLLTYLRKHFILTFPLSKEWINLPPKKTTPISTQNSPLPPLPADFNIVNTTAKTSFPITKPKDLSPNIKLAHQSFHFTRIPDSWILIPKKLPLTMLEETNKQLKNLKLNFSLSLKHNTDFSTNIKTLHQHFEFHKLPNNFITFENQSEPDISLLFNY